MENYKILNQIGEGTYGIVYKAILISTQQVVAIKQFKESMENQQIHKTALREIRVLKRLKHENIVSLIDAFRHNNKFVLVFEYVPDTILNQLESHANGMDHLAVQKIMWQLLKATSYMHSKGIIHRDIKPENLLLSKYGVLKICDFGFARFMEGPDSKYTDYVSTRWYRAPELLTGDANYGKVIDIWAIGCMLAEMLQGTPLFPGKTDYHTLLLILDLVQGNLTEKQKSAFLSNEIFKNSENIKLPNKDPNSLGKLQTVLTRFDEVELSFIENCLKIDPSQRLDCEQLLSLKYFEGFAKWFKDELSSSIEKEKADLMGTTKTTDVSNEKSTEKSGENEPSSCRENPVTKKALQSTIKSFNKAISNSMHNQASLSTKECVSISTVNSQKKPQNAKYPKEQFKSVSNMKRDQKHSNLNMSKDRIEAHEISSSKSGLFLPSVHGKSIESKQNSSFMQNPSKIIALPRILNEINECEEDTYQVSNTNTSCSNSSLRKSRI